MCILYVNLQAYDYFIPWWNPVCTSLDIHLASLDKIMHTNEKKTVDLKTFNFNNSEQ